MGCKSMARRERIIPSATTGVPDGRDGLRHIEFPVEGLQCASCVDHVRRALLAVPGVVSASINPTGLASVTYDSARVNLTAIDRAVQEAGYPIGTAEARLGLVGVY